MPYVLSLSHNTDTSIDNSRCLNSYNTIDHNSNDIEPRFCHTIHIDIISVTQVTRNNNTSMDTGYSNNCNTIASLVGSRNNNNVSSQDQADTHIQ